MVMKELSIEEKAKRYDEAISIAREINNEQRIQSYNIMTRVFPELIESEDEKIRKALIDMFSTVNKKDWRNIPTENIVAWLEKQGEPKPVDKVEPQVEPKVEPQFKVGDWITDGKAPLYVTKFEVGYGYELKDVNEKVFHFVSPDLVEEHYHLWTIQDAKYNDILVSYNNLPFIFDGRFDEHSIGAHGGINVAKYFKACVLKGSWTNSNGVKPATKEQQDLLFSKMKEAGYKFDKYFNIIKI